LLKSKKIGIGIILGIFVFFIPIGTEGIEENEGVIKVLTISDYAGMFWDSMKQHDPCPTCVMPSVVPSSIMETDVFLRALTECGYIWEYWNPKLDQLPKEDEDFAKKSYGECWTRVAVEEAKSDLTIELQKNNTKLIQENNELTKNNQKLLEEGAKKDEQIIQLQNDLKEQSDSLAPYTIAGFVVGGLGFGYMIFSYVKNKI